MNKSILFILLCFGFTSCVSSIEASKAIEKNIENNDIKGIMNPFKYFGLEKTSKIEVQLTKCIEVDLVGSDEDGCVDIPQEKVLFDKETQKIILNELNREIEYGGFCLCTGDGDIVFTLTDGSEVILRVKHCGGTLETKYEASDDRNFFVSDNFEKIIRKHYSERDRDSCEIDDRYKSGKITEEQKEKEWLEWEKRYDPETWLLLTKDQALKDEYYQQAILGSWKNKHECNDENNFSLYTFLSDGEVWQNGKINISNELITFQKISSWEIKDGIITIILKSMDNFGQGITQVEKKTIFKIIFITNNFFIWQDNDGKKHTYRKVGI